jgi:hypothetical protein
MKAGATEGVQDIYGKNYLVESVREIWAEV